MQSFKGGQEGGGLVTPPVSPRVESEEVGEGEGLKEKGDLGKWEVFMSYCWLNSGEAAEMGQVGSRDECGVRYFEDPAFWPFK